MAEKKMTKDMVNAGETAAAAKKAAETVYAVDEIAEAAGVFGATPDLVRAAFAVAGKAAATETEARNIINKFKKEAK